MNVSEFVNSYLSVNNATSKDAMLKKLNVKSYVSISKKMSFIKNVVDSSNSIFDENHNFIRHELNSMGQHMLFLVFLIEEYTDLKFNGDKIIDDYDLLSQNGLIEKIIEMIGEKEFQECSFLLALYKDDFMQKNFSTQAFIKNQADRVCDLIKALSSPIIDSVNEKFKDFNPDDLRNLMDFMKNGVVVKDDN